MKVLADTSVWINHLRGRDESLSPLLRKTRVVTHEFIVGELLTGHVAHRSELRHSLERLVWLPVLSHTEFASFVASNGLAGSGLSFVDIHLLGSVSLTPGVNLLTADRRLGEAANRLSGR